MNFEDFLQLHTRRKFLTQWTYGTGVAAISTLLAAEDPPPRPHFTPRAKAVIFFFMSGAPSQIDLFDPKPMMMPLHGQGLPESLQKDLVDQFKKIAKIMASPREFKSYGQCGMEFSDLVPHIGSCADDICMVRSVHTDVTNHHPGQLLMNCGSPLPGRPSIGSWVTYGLGSESKNLPAFVVLTSNSGMGIEGGTSLWSSGFLPSNYRGVAFRGSGDPILHLSNPEGISPETQRARLDVLRDLNRKRFADTGDLEIASRIASYELAFRMQAAAPELTDLSKESKSTLEMYGIDNETTRAFGTNCILARRMVERGVRFIQIYHSSWDDHKDLNKNHARNCGIVDKPTAALLKDLKQRGLLDETLVIWGAEFGRSPMNEVRLASPEAGREGRDHHALAFTVWLSGGGIKRGQIIGRTDEIGFNVVEDKLHVHDLQATILHCLGIDHTRLTYRHQGRDFRLTDVGGRVIDKLLA
jgi:hypothetical protein